MFEKYDDGDSIVFDAVKKNTLILNETATIILELLLDNDDVQKALLAYMDFSKEQYSICDQIDLKKDFEETFKLLTNENVIN